MTDGRYSSLHMTDNALLALDFPEGALPPLPAFDDDVSVPPERDPPKPDEDDTLPSRAHPSYPYGRPYAPARDLTNPSSLSLAHNLYALSAQPMHGVGSGARAANGWSELGLHDLLPPETGREVPPGMAGAKRGPEDDRDWDEETMHDGDDEANHVPGSSSGDNLASGSQPDESVEDDMSGAQPSHQQQHPLDLSDDDRRSDGTAAGAYESSMGEGDYT